MLEVLRIKNIAVIDSAEVPFKAGLNILSGETGAGKSIVIEAISLLLGSRASTELIRSGCDEAVVEGLFDISELDWVGKRLEAHGLDADAETLLIKRTVSRSGKHRIHINGESATLSMLQSVCEGLVDLCGQHEHQSLTRPATQLELLDRYGGLEKQAAELGTNHGRYRLLQARLEELREASAERARQTDFLSFQIAELKAAELEAGEDEKLQAEKTLLQSVGSRVTLANGAVQALEDEEAGILNGLRATLTKARGLAQLDPSVASLSEAMERACVEAEEVCVSLNRYLAANEGDPGRLEAVQERLSRLADLRRKYGGNVTEMLATLANLEAQFASIGGAEQSISALEGEIAALGAELSKKGRKLSQARAKAATLLSDSASQELKDLNMKDAAFTLEITSEEDPAAWQAGGPDSILFHVRTNRGEEPKPLAKIASGGELSRLMLAIRRVIADRGGIGVYLFDEIDAGIGGQTAFQVGKKLKSVAAHNQVICITHLPQVAAFASHHLVVRKSVSGKRTMTEVISLPAPERREELARMLAGPALTKKSLESAAELMQLAK